MIHGYQGSTYDMEKVKNFLKIFTRGCIFLNISTIHYEIDEGIEYLGRKVASEIIVHLENAYKPYNKINFIAFSLGGVLCRAALEHLADYKEKICMVVTFGSPHLGLSCIGNTLVNLGIWFMTKFENSQNLK